MAISGRVDPDEKGPDDNGVYTINDPGRPGAAIDDPGRLQLLNAVPAGSSPCRSYHHRGGETIRNNDIENVAEDNAAKAGLTAGGAASVILQAPRLTQPLHGRTLDSN